MDFKNEGPQQIFINQRFLQIEGHQEVFYYSNSSGKVFKPQENLLDIFTLQIV